MNWSQFKRMSNLEIDMIIAICYQFVSSFSLNPYILLTVLTIYLGDKG